MNQRLHEIFIESDLSLSAAILGVAMVFWGCTALIMTPKEFFDFSDTMKLGSVWFWFANYTLVGAGFFCCAFRKFPPLLSLLIGGYAVLAWTWVASMRGSANFTSGVTLNAVVIVMGCLMIQRSGKPR